MDRRLFTAGLTGAAALSAAGKKREPGYRNETFAPLAALSPELSRFNPQRRILFYDDFDNGINGWTELQANHNGNLDDLRPVLSDMRPPQLSSCTFFDIGTHGSLDGTYALKLATRPRPFHTSAAIKRLTYSTPCRVQFEMWFTYKAEQTFDGNGEWDGNISPAELHFGDFTVSADICEGDVGARYMPALRYLNTDRDGKPAQKWMYTTSLHTTTKMDRQGLTLQTEDYHVQNIGDWSEVPGGQQPLCFNELATKINWHYLRWIIDLRKRRSETLDVNGRTMDLREVPVPVYGQQYRALNHLLNFLVDVRTHKAVRNFLFIDSVLVSMDA